MTDISLSKVEEKLILKENKTIIVRPKKESDNLSKGDTVEWNGAELLVLDVREYPRIGDLVKIENLPWLSIDAHDDVEARKVLEGQYSDEHTSGEKFVAIEFAPQN